MARPNGLRVLTTLPKDLSPWETRVENGEYRGCGSGERKRRERKCRKRWTRAKLPTCQWPLTSSSSSKQRLPVPRTISRPHAVVMWDCVETPLFLPPGNNVSSRAGMWQALALTHGCALVEIVAARAMLDSRKAKAETPCGASCCSSSCRVTRGYCLWIIFTFSTTESCWVCVGSRASMGTGRKFTKRRTKPALRLLTRRHGMIRAILVVVGLSLSGLWGTSKK